MAISKYIAKAPYFLGRGLFVRVVFLSVLTAWVVVTTIEGSPPTFSEDHKISAHRAPFVSLHCYEIIYRVITVWVVGTTVELIPVLFAVSDNQTSTLAMWTRNLSHHFSWA